MMTPFEAFYTKGIAHHLKERKRLDTSILLFVLHTLKNNILKISPIIAYNHSPMDHAQDAIDSIQPDMYLICAESWVYCPKATFKEFEKNYKYGQISKMEEKIECMSFIGKTMDGEEKHSEIHKIIRKDKKIIGYKKLNLDGMYSPKLI